MIIKLIEDDDVVSDEVKGDWWTQRILIGQNASNDNEHKQTDHKNDPKQEKNEENTTLIIDEENNEKQITTNNNKEEQNQNEVEMQEIDSQKSTENGL
jgi:hypothetical protein